MAAKKEDLLKQEAMLGLLSTLINLEITKIPQTIPQLYPGYQFQGK